MTALAEPKKSTMGKWAIGNQVAGVGMVGVDSYMRIKEGQNPVSAVGGALVSNAMWGLVPGGQLAAIGVMAGMAVAQVAPAVSNAIDAKKAEHSAKLNRFGSNWQSSEAQQMLQTQGINQISAARDHFAKRMANHARNAQKVY